MIGRETDFQRRLLGWYDQFRRDLPWRAEPGRSGPLDPYHVLVSEAMLQQTQVATVVPYYLMFLDRFPTLQSLAAADEQDVLRLWQGLGYYSRARNLQAAARRVVEHHCGTMPRTVDELRALPGVGRYTAGAVASIAFDCRAPIVDGNVARVICRLDKIEADPREKPTVELLWSRAEAILPKRRCGDFNSALMELGATVCTPRNPQCLLCPERDHCAAFAAGVQERIPPPRKAKVTPLNRRVTICLRRGNQWLIEQRPAKGRWAGMWQFITVEAPGPGTRLSPAFFRRIYESAGKPQKLGLVTHGLTHRRYEFDVYAAECDGAGPANGNGTTRTWTTLHKLSDYPLPRPHLKIAEMLHALV